MRTLKVIFGMFLITASLNTVSAQEQLTPEQKAQAQTERMTTNLTLSEEQVPKVYEINLGIALKNEAIRNNTEMSEEVKSESIKGNNEGRKAMLKNVLTEEQFVKFEEGETMKIKMKEFKVIEKPVKTEKTEE